MAQLDVFYKNKELGETYTALIRFILGAFLIPYLIMLVFEGVPLLYVELTVGQMLRKGSMGSWIKISPYMQGRLLVTS